MAEQMKPPKDGIIAEVQKLITEITNGTATIHKEITHGKISYALYSDYFEIANYQLNQVDSVIGLANSQRYRESFIILRTLFEYMLLFKLMTVADKYFLLFKKKRGESDEVAIKRLNGEIQKAKSEGKKTSAKKAVKYGRDGVVAVIYQGPYVDGEKKKGNLVPYYLSLFNQFDPTAAFLDQDDYFDYLPSSFRVAERRERTANTQRENKYVYTHYLSFSGMLKSLEINRIYTKKELTRIKAHYNFLSSFTHPTKDSIEKLKVRNQHNSHIQYLSETREDKPILCMLATLYLANIVASISGDITKVLKDAPKKYIKDVNDIISDKIDKLASSTDYFWFIQNEPHDYDKFVYCLHHANADELKNDYRAVDSKKVTFNKDILTRMERLQLGQSNGLWKHYTPPFTLS